MTPPPHQDAGYTLIESLAALLVVSLMLASLVATARLADRIEKHTRNNLSASRALVRTTQTLREWLQDQGPFVAKGLQGSQSAILFPCDRGSCAATLTPDAIRLSGMSAMKTPESLRFSYISEGRTYDSWPQSLNAPAKRLEAIVITTFDGKMRGAVPLIIDQGLTCAYDDITRSCREEGR